VWVRFLYRFWGGFGVPFGSLLGSFGRPWGPLWADLGSLGRLWGSIGLALADFGGLWGTFGGPCRVN
jgi:hypothetical protein